VAFYVGAGEVGKIPEAGTQILEMIWLPATWTTEAGGGFGR
jgi:hypothetical protein